MSGWPKNGTQRAISGRLHGVELKQEVADPASVLPRKMDVAGCKEEKALGRKLPPRP
jgi:hypothetical protein